jgi:hypothetical protein
MQLGDNWDSWPMRCANPDMAMASIVLKKLVQDKEEERVP